MVGAQLALSGVPVLALVPGDRWAGEAVFAAEGSIEHVAEALPEFERRPFRLSLNGGSNTEAADVLVAEPAADENRYRDLIVRKPGNGSSCSIPVGVVSKGYVLVQHRELLTAVTDALRERRVRLDEVVCEVELSEYGARMALHLQLPSRYSFDPGDGNMAALRVECLNSVDLSTPLQILFGWFRFVCRNGMIAGSVLAHLRRRHERPLTVDEVPTIVEAGLKLARRERRLLARWWRTPITEERLTVWVDGPVQERWGVKAAARTFHIACTGSDADFRDRFEERKPPHLKAMRPTGRVPGAKVPADNAFAVSQCLAWVATTRREVQERLDWMQDVPRLMGALMKMRRPR